MRAVPPSVLAAVLGLFFAVSLLAATRAASDWRERPDLPYHAWLDRAALDLPADARILVLVPSEAYRQRDPCVAAARLHPRPVFALPPKARTLEEARDWARSKGVTWVLFLGGTEFRPDQAWLRKLDDVR